MNLVKKIWDDPVGSKVISAAIISILGIPALLIWTPITEYLVVAWQFIRDSLPGVWRFAVDNFFIGTTIISTVALFYVFIKSRLQRSRANLAKATLSPSGLFGTDWLDSLTGSEFTKYAFLMWFPLNHSLKSPQYYFDTESLDHVPEVDDLIRHRVIKIQRENMIQFTVRIDNTIYRYLERQIQSEVPLLPQSEREAVVRIGRSDLGSMIRGRSRL